MTLKHQPESRKHNIQCRQYVLRLKHHHIYTFTQAHKQINLCNCLMVEVHVHVCIVNKTSPQSHSSSFISAVHIYPQFSHLLVSTFFAVYLQYFFVFFVFFPQNVTVHVCMTGNSNSHHSR